MTTCIQCGKRFEQDPEIEWWLDGESDKSLCSDECFERHFIAEESMTAADWEDASKYATDAAARAPQL